MKFYYAFVRQISHHPAIMNAKGRQVIFLYPSSIDDEEEDTEYYPLPGYVLKELGFLDEEGQIAPFEVETRWKYIPIDPKALRLPLGFDYCPSTSRDGKNYEIRVTNINIDSIGGKEMQPDVEWMD